MRFKAPPAAGAAGAGVCARATTTVTVSEAIRTTRNLNTPFIHSSSERRADRKLDGAKILALAPVEVDAIVDADGTERRLPADPGAGRFSRVGQVELRLEAVRVADVEEAGRPEVERQRHDVFQVPQHLGGAADADPGVVDR